MMKEIYKSTQAIPTPIRKDNSILCKAKIEDCHKDRGVIFHRRIVTKKGIQSSGEKLSYNNEEIRG